jgi:hypothetical protein
MARIELRDCTVRFKDGGLVGVAAANEVPAESAVDLDIDGVVMVAATTDEVPIGSHFTIAHETVQTVHTVTDRTPSSGPTTNIEFSPALGAGVGYSEDDELTFAPMSLEIKTADGFVSYTEHRNYEYKLDRGDLDTVREGDQVPMDVKVDLVYEHITTGTGEAISPMDALKGVGSADDWITSSVDPCEPYAIDIEVEHDPSCGTSQKEITLFPDFRAETKEINYKDATIALTGKCNAIEPVVSRET